MAPRKDTRSDAQPSPYRMRVDEAFDPEELDDRFGASEVESDVSGLGARDLNLGEPGGPEPSRSARPSTLSSP